MVVRVCPLRAFAWIFVHFLTKGGCSESPSTCAPETIKSARLRSLAHHPFSPPPSSWTHYLLLPNMAFTGMTALSSSSSSNGSSSHSGRNPLPFTRSYTDFEMERSERPAKTHSYSRAQQRRKGAPITDPKADGVFESTVATLMAAKSRPFSISGHIPLDPGALTIFFRSQVSRRFLSFFCGNVICNLKFVRLILDEF